MACFNCEVIPQKLEKIGYLYLWAPLGHTGLKIRKFLDDYQFSYQMTKDCLRVALPDTSGDHFFQNLMSRISLQEATDTKVLRLDQEKEPSFEDFSKVTTLNQLSAFYQSHWLIDLLAEDRLKCVFQPIYSKENLVTPWAAECLLRGIDENNQEIGAGPLFQAAEDSNLMFQLDLKARLKAVETFGPLHLPLNLFINFCPTAIYDPKFCLKSTISKIQGYNINPSSIVFEVTESQKHTDLDHLLSIMSFYRAAGFKVALDDVGAGYSGINILTVLKPDIVKLDIEMIRDVESDPSKATFVQKIIEACQGLNAKVLAEGIETAAAADWCLQKQCGLLSRLLFQQTCCDTGSEN